MPGWAVTGAVAWCEAAATRDLPPELPHTSNAQAAGIVPIATSIFSIPLTPQATGYLLDAWQAALEYTAADFQVPRKQSSLAPVLLIDSPAETWLERP